MAEAENVTKVPTAQAYFATSYAFNNGTTSTANLLIWRALSQHLEERLLPMTGAELMAATALNETQIESAFRQSYYLKYYGFRRFNTLEEWRDWVETEGVIYVPALHDPKPAPEAGDDEVDDEAEDEDEA